MINKIYKIFKIHLFYGETKFWYKVNVPVIGILVSVIGTQCILLDNHWFWQSFIIHVTKLYYQLL